MKKVFAILSVVAIATVTLVSCNKKEEVNKLLRVTLSEKSVDLAAGEKVTITAKFTPETEAAALTWETSDEKIATVSDGVITAVAPGVAVIRAIANSITGVVEVNVFGGGNSAWSIKGTIHDSNWAADYVGVDKDGAVLFEHVPLVKGDKFLLRKDKADTEVRGGKLAAVGTAFEAKNSITDTLVSPAAGYHDIYYFAEKEALLVLDAGAELPADKDIPNFVSAITIDGNFAEWADVTTGVATTADPGVYQVFKVTYDSQKLYFYSKRDNRAAIWNGGGYFYYDIDADNNAETGVDKDGIVGLETWMYIKPFAGTSDAPAFADAVNGGASADGVLKNVVFAGANNGTVGEGTVEVEVSIPLADAGVKIGDTIKVYSWSNKDGYDVQSKPIEIELK